MGRFSRLGKNTVLVMLGNTSSKILAIVMLPLYTAWLSVEDYGITDLITVYATFLMGIVSGCIADAIFVIPKDEDEQGKKTHFTSGALFLVVSLAITGLFFGCMSYFFEAENIHNVFSDNIWFVYLIMAANVVFVYLQQFCRAIDKMLIYSFSGLGVSGFTALLSFLLIPSYGVFGFILANVLAYILTCIYIFVGIKAYRYLSISSYRLQSVTELLKYSIPLIPNATMWWLVHASNRPLLETYFGTFAIGVLAVASKFPAFVNIVLGAINTSWQISVLEEYKKKDFRDFFNKGLQFFAFVLISVSCIMSICSEWAIRTFTSNVEYQNAWIYIPLLTLSPVFSCMSGLVGSVFSASRKSKYYFYSSIWAAATALACNFLLIPIWGIWGAVVSSVLSMAAMLGTRLYFARKFVRITHKSKYLELLLLWGAYFSLVVLFEGKKLIIGIITLTIIYIFCNLEYFKQLLVIIQIHSSRRTKF